MFINTKYNIILILVPLDLKETNHPVDHDIMTVVIRYKTLYLINNTDSLILSFELDTDVTLRSILGILCLLAMGAVIDLVKD